MIGPARTPLLVAALALALMVTATASRHLAAEVETATPVPPLFVGGDYYPPQP